MSMHFASFADKANTTGNGFVVTAPHVTDILSGTLREAFTVDHADFDSFAELLRELDRISIV